MFFKKVEWFFEELIEGLYDGIKLILKVLFVIGIIVFCIYAYKNGWMMLEG